MTDISRAPIHGHYAHLVTHPGYYQLYALYHDYQINNARHAEMEYADLLRERVQVIQPLLALVQPYRKSWALRLFTERQSMGRFHPTMVHELWRQLAEVIAAIGPPKGWQAPVGRPAHGQDAHHMDEGGPSGLERQRALPQFPRAPINYEQDV